MPEQTNCERKIWNKQQKNVIENYASKIVDVNWREWWTQIDFNVQIELIDVDEQKQQ